MMQFIQYQYFMQSISYSGEVSSVIALSFDKFNSFEYLDDASPKDIGNLTLPPPSLSEKLVKQHGLLRVKNFLNYATLLVCRLIYSKNYLIM